MVSTLFSKGDLGIDYQYSTTLLSAADVGIGPAHPKVLIIERQGALFNTIYKGKPSVHYMIEKTMKDLSKP